MSCKVFGCRNSKIKRDAVTVLYSFPKQNALRYSWVSACANTTIDIYKPDANQAVCADHFKDSDFLPEIKDGVRQLKYGTLPTENLPDDAYSDFPEKLPVRTPHEPETPLPEATEKESVPKGIHIPCLLTYTTSF